ncbi:heat shock factor protein 1 isoform X2 [Gouania willdenowi]|uniref:heat shock factor protein 1 isoform X2 n=1 Tax=Gouania willdenowi TaxID=441366 RepID=UPI001054E878|nr:heat shock factor protein 1-like isoform X2 [Gouania willdenowi]
MEAVNVPAFLTKLWMLVEDPNTDSLIRWSQSGSSFHVYDQGRFSKEVLPKFFKHNNMASFIRQLNMYGFRKVVHMEQSGLVKPETDDTEFQHPFFIRGEEHLLENIKRKVTMVSRQEEVKVSTENISQILNDVQQMKGKQETIDFRISAMKQENEALWREVASLRQKHTQQQKVVNKLLQFLVSLVQTNRILGVKRKIPLMLNDSSSTHSLPKYSRPLSLEPVQSPANIFSDSGPIISDVTEVATPTSEDVLDDWTDLRRNQSMKEEPSEGACPVSAVETPFSPTTFIDSILLDEPSTAPPLALMTSDPAEDPLPPCQTVACIERSELSNHVDVMDNRLENLQNALNKQSLSLDCSPLMEYFSCPDFDVDCLDTLLTEEAPRGNDVTGKELVQFIGSPVEVGVANLEEEPIFVTAPLSPAHLDPDL